MIPQAPSIIVNCPRTNSNLLQVTKWEDGLELAFLYEDSGDQPTFINGDPQFMTYADYPELREIARVTSFDTIWDADLLWSLATINEDHAVTPLGHYALHNDGMWDAAETPDFINGSDEAVAV